jgi:hypothetical protein
MANLIHYRLFQVVFIAPTNFRGSRIKIKDLRHNKTVIINQDHRKNDICECAVDYLKSKKIKCQNAFGSSNEFYILMTKDFATQIK